MTVDEARKKIVHSIIATYEEDEARNIAELLLEHVTILPLTERIIKKNESLSDKQEAILLESLNRLQNHEPIQYITNECWFAGMKLYVDKNVLIPRPETEELVEWIVSDRKLNPKSDAEASGRNPKFLDIGTGSGCIAIALKTKLPEVEMWACDVSDEALNVARVNADALHAAIDFVPLNFLDAKQRQQLPRLDVIVSNPPYVPEQDKSQMKKNVVEYEPSVALFVPSTDPLIFFNSIADFGNENLHENGSIYVEIHEDLGDKVEDLFRMKGYDSIVLKKDLQGKDRMIRSSRH
jgi:release factor glutamine methyltransferase